MNLVPQVGETKISSKRKIDLSYDHIPTGVVELDRVLGGGYPIGAFICVQGDIGTGTSTFCLQTVWNRLTSGGLATYICVDELPDTVVKHFRSFGYDIDHYVDAGRFLLYDGLPLINSLAASSQGQNGVTERKNLLRNFLEDYKSAACAAKKRNSPITLPSVSVVDSFSSLAPYIDLKTAYVLTHLLADSARVNKNLFLMIVHTGAIEANVVCACNAVADGIIRLAQLLKRGTLKRVIRIEKLAFTPTPSELLEFKITTRNGLQITSSI
jgi:KaiC/GvpD/RAD55 family RecA-like ATPase